MTIDKTYMSTVIHKLVEDIKAKEMDYGMNGVKVQISFNLAEAQILLDALKEQTSWVPVSEGLPKPQENGDKDYSDWVLVTINLGKDNDTLTGVAYYCFSEKKWYAKGLVIGDVTAWMPRPKPYKAESEKI